MKSAGNERGAMTSYERWTVAVGLATAVVGLFGFVLVAIQLRILQAQISASGDEIERDHEQRRKEATFAFASATRQTFYDLRSAGLPSVNTVNDVEEYLGQIADWKDPDHPDNVLVQRYLGWWETLATGVNLGAYELEVIDRLNGPEIVRVWLKFEPWILARREAYSQPNLYHEIELLESRIVNR